MAVKARNSFKTLTFHKGQVIIKEGQDSHESYLIKNGAVTIYKLVNNRRIVISQLKNGQIFGEMGVIAGRKRMANAMASEFTELIVIDKPALDEALKKSHPIVSTITKLLIDRLIKADSTLYGSDQNSDIKDVTEVFTKICAILEIICKAKLDSIEGGRKDDNEIIIPFEYIYSKVKSIIVATQIEIDTVIQKFVKLQLVEIKKDKKNNFIKITNPQHFIKVIGHLSAEASKNEQFAKIDFEFIDILDFSKHVKSNPDLIYKKLSNNEIPENLFFFHKDKSLEWAKEVGDEFFQRTKKKRLKPEDVEAINDIVYIDNATCQKAFSELGMYKLSIMVAYANDDAKEKIYKNLSSKNRSVIEEENEVEREIDEIEAEDIEEELIGIIRRLKGFGDKKDN